MTTGGLPDLTFPMVEYGRTEIPWDLRPLLYRGGAGVDVRNVFNLMADGTLGTLLPERLGLVNEIHQTLTGNLVGGLSRHTVYSRIRGIRELFTFCDQNEQVLSLETVEGIYRSWTDALINSGQLKLISKDAVYRKAATLSKVLDEVLGRTTPLIQTSRVRFVRKPRRAVGGISSDKENLAATFEFGSLLLDIIAGLEGDKMWAPLPLSIPLRTGQTLTEWSGLRPKETLATLRPGYKGSSSNVQARQAYRNEVENSKSLEIRYPLANLRIEAELLVFIAQTSMNLAQAYRLKVDDFSYKSTIDGYEVRKYKHRKKGEVLFEIYSEYRPLFKSYLDWRKQVFPDSDELFPLVRQYGRPLSSAPVFPRIKDVCRRVGVDYISARALRKTRINWLLRKTQDADLTAEQAQHTKETLLRVYEQPSQQVAMAEIIQFWSANDPALQNAPVLCVAPGVCDGTPRPIANLPVGAPAPDCTQPSGCLFCAHHRDIDSEDYVWSVASMRHLKTLILHCFRPAKRNKPDSAQHVRLAIDVLSTKLAWFNESNQTRQAWVAEALERIAESDFHPHWRYLIESSGSL